MRNLGKIFRFPYVLWWMPLAATVGFFYPVLFGGKLFFNFGFSRTEDMPIYFWFSQAFKQGTWRINSLYFGGAVPYLAQMALLHPISLLFNSFIQPIRAYYWIIALSFTGQWYAFYLLSRKLKISSIAAVLASFVWVFYQWNIQFDGLEAIGVFLVWVPVLFFLALKISEDKHKYWYSGLAALILAPNWVFNLAQTTLYLATALVIFAVFLDFQSHRFTFLKYKNTLIWVIIILLSVAIVSPFLKADYAIYSLGFRNGGLSYQKSVNDYYNGFDLIHFISPFVILPFVNTEYVHFYLGILPLLLIFLAWRMKNGNSYVKFFKWLAVITLLIAVKYSPLFYIITKVPIFNLFRGYAKFLFLTGLSLALLSGFGLDMLKEGRGLDVFNGISRFYKKFLMVVAAVLVGTNLVYNFAFDALIKFGYKIFLRFGYSHTLQKQPAYYIDKVKELLSSWFYQFSFSNIEVWLTIVTLLSTGFVVDLLLKNKISVRLFLILAIVIIYFSSFFIWQRYHRFVSISVLDSTPAIEFLINHSDNRYRTITFNLGIETYKKMGLDYKNPEELYKFEVATLTTDVFMYYNIETLNGHDAFLTTRQESVLEFNGQFATQTMTPEEKKRLFESKIGLLSMMNVKYILSSVPLDEPFIKRLDSTITDTQIPLYVYENPQVLPRFYFAKSAQYIKEGLSDADLAQEVTKINNFKDKTLVECGDCENYSPIGEGLINDFSYKPDEMRINLKSDGNSWLVLSNSFLPGWHAFVDGKEVRIYRANYLFQAIKVPARNHNIMFEYKIL